MCLQERRPLPDFIKNAPELMPGLELYLNAFWELHTCRQIGFGVGPIPWTAVRHYGNMLDLDELEFSEFSYLIKQLDSAYLQWRNEQDKTK